MHRVNKYPIFVIDKKIRYSQYKYKTMKKLTDDQRREIKNNYPSNWYEAMINEERASTLLNYIDAHKEYNITYSQAFFSSAQIDVYELEGEVRLFNSKNSVFDLSPLRTEDAEGDWKEWVKKAKLVKELR